MPRPYTRILWNGVSLVGFLLAILGLGASLVLLALDLIGIPQRPYTGILTFLLFPSILFGGLFLVPLGAWLHRRRLRKAGGLVGAYPVFDLNQAPLRRLVLGFSALTLVILLLSILGGYRAYEYTESVEFCGELCHSVMEPEHVAFLDSSHARVRCVDCHVGEGPGWYLKAKVSGLRQVYQLTTNTLSRPIETPLPEMRSAQETCLRCHWPEKSLEDQLLPRTRFAHDQLNTRRSFLILLKTGQRSTNGEHREGIHWHANSGNRVEYVAADARRSKILQVRSVLHEGPPVEYFDPDETPDLAALAGLERRVLDCTDCHNRPGHPFLSPEAAVDEAMEGGAIDTAVPFAKTSAVAVLAAATAGLEEGGAAYFEEQLRKVYSERHASVLQEASGAFPALARELDRLYRRNVFPSMKVTWATYPDHNGHRESAGCLRCHDGKHRTADGKVLSGACDLCHGFAAYAPDASCSTLAWRSE